MTFHELMSQAKEGNGQAVETLLGLYKPLLVKESVVDGIFDEDLYQELCLTLLHCLDKFRI